MSQPFQPVESESNIYSFLNTIELKGVIITILGEMLQKMREIYQLSKEHQLTNAEIADLLILAPKTVKNQIHQALFRIRKELKKRNLSLFIIIL